MLNEPTSSVNPQTATRAPMVILEGRDDAQLHELRAMVGKVLLIEHESFPDMQFMPGEDGLMLMASGSRMMVSFEGQLLMDSEAAYDQLDTLLAPQNRLALFREEEGKHVIHVLSGRVNPRPRAWWPNALLFIATLFSVLLVGLNIALTEIADDNVFLARAILNNGLIELWRGLPYALSIMLILGAHELGHYFAARHHKLAVTLPYFIPLPFFSLFGTLGAFIQLRQPMRNRKMLIDVGAAGPLAGLIFAIPILLIGLASQRPEPMPGLGGVYEGDSIVYALAKTLTYGRFIPDGRVDICFNCNQFTYAGWTGLLVTALNLFPVGQLDGGHILYAAFGDRARRLYAPLIALLFFLTLFVSETWLLWLMMLLFLGRVYAMPLDMITPLDASRRWLAIASIVIFILIFVPAPMTRLGGGGILNNGLFAVVLPSMAANLYQRLQLKRAVSVYRTK
jgi:hypothetical protein